jgi:hypothetical protein
MLRKASLDSLLAKMTSLHEAEVQDLFASLIVWGEDYGEYFTFYSPAEPHSKSYLEKLSNALKGGKYDNSSEMIDAIVALEDKRAGLKDYAEDEKINDEEVRLLRKHVSMDDFSSIVALVLLKRKGITV